jgi:DNA-binding winged helix-turn-helix (wHTH) protein/Tfp pilus assembly protein PilF
MAFNTFPEGATVGAWRVSARAGRLSRQGVERTVEPKVMDLLVLLASRPGEVITREEIVGALWPETIVGDDTLARVVSKLRKAFDDDAKTPAFVETISKRGYRLIAEVDLAPAAVMPARRWRQSAFAAVAAALLAIGVWSTAGAPSETATLIARAKDYYFQYTRADNEAAIELYERVLEAEPDHAEARAGLATALVQRVLRWPDPPGEPDFTRTTLAEALASGRTETAQAQAWLSRARELSRRAAAGAPHDAFVHQAHGLSLAASRDFDGAEAAYERAIAIDADAWGALINLGDLQDIRGAPERALPFYERAYAAMERAYASEPQRVRLWHAEVGVLIAGRHELAGDRVGAESWYRRVLARAPLHETAIVGLATLLKRNGDAQGAAQLCSGLVARTGANAACEALTSS